MLLINWIENTPQALYHFHSMCALHAHCYAEAGRYQRKLQPLLTAVLMRLVIRQKPNHRTSDTEKQSFPPE